MHVIWDNLAFLLLGQFPNGPIGGLALTIFLATVAGVASMVIGLVLGILQALGGIAIRTVIFVYVQIIRGVPLITFVFWIYFFFPAVMGFRASGVESVLIALAVFNGAFITETMRGAIMSVPKGQFESARSLGFGRWLTYGLIIVPQAIRKIYPPLVNRFVNLLLGTSMVYIVGVNELTSMAVIVNNREMEYPAEIFGFVALLYFALCFPMSLYLERMHRRAKIKGF